MIRKLALVAAAFATTAMLAPVSSASAAYRAHGNVGASALRGFAPHRGVALQRSFRPYAYRSNFGIRRAPFAAGLVTAFAFGAPAYAYGECYYVRKATYSYGGYFVGYRRVRVCG